MKKALAISLIFALFLVTGCNLHSLKEDRIACANKGYDISKGSLSNIVFCKDRDTKEIIQFDYKDLDYTEKEFVEDCLHRNPPSVVSCVIGCLAYKENEHTQICGEGIICKWDGELDCNIYCQEKYGMT